MEKGKVKQVEIKGDFTERLFRRIHNKTGLKGKELEQQVIRASMLMSADTGNIKAFNHFEKKSNVLQGVN